MSDTTKITTNSEANDEGAPTGEVEDPKLDENGNPAEEPQEGGEADESGDEGEAPTVENLTKELTKVRQEAAARRVQVRELEKRLAEAKTPEQFAEAVAEYQGKVSDLERQVTVSKVATAHGLPTELAELLKGETEEELTAHAKKLAKFATGAVTDPKVLRGGLNPGDKSDDTDPTDVVKAVGRRRR